MEVMQDIITQMERNFFLFKRKPLPFDINKKYKITYDCDGVYLEQINYLFVQKKTLANPSYGGFSDNYYSSWLNEDYVKKYIKWEIDRKNINNTTEKDIINKLYTENEYLQKRIQEILNNKL